MTFQSWHLKWKARRSTLQARGTTISEAHHKRSVQQYGATTGRDAVASARTVSRHVTQVTLYTSHDVKHGFHHVPVTFYVYVTVSMFEQYGQEWVTRTGVWIVNTCTCKCIGYTVLWASKYVCLWSAPSCVIRVLHTISRAYCILRSSSFQHLHVHMYMYLSRSRTLVLVSMNSLSKLVDTCTVMDCDISWAVEDRRPAILTPTELIFPACWHCRCQQGREKPNMVKTREVEQVQELCTGTAARSIMPCTFDSCTTHILCSYTCTVNMLATAAVIH